MQHFIMLFGAGVLYEIYLVLMGLSASTDNYMLGWELDWMLPFYILLSGIFLIFYVFPLDILNLVLLLSFIRIDRKRNQANSWWKSIGLFFLLLLMIYAIAACIWGLMFWWHDFSERHETISQFEFLKPGSSISLGYILLCNCIFMLFFLPFWHYKLKSWSSHL